MCVAIVKTPKGKISDTVLAACFEANSHGAGFAWVENNGVAIHKGFFTFKSFIEAYRPVEERIGEDSPFLIHFRISTGGNITTDNCHPFRTPHGAVMHNGYLFYVNGPKSDTHLFAERIGQRLSREGVLLHKAAMEASLGSSNKLAFLYPDKSVEILNEKEGSWIDGAWFSNCHWQRRHVPVGGTRTPVNRDAGDYDWRQRRADAAYAYGDPVGRRGFGGREG